MTSTIDVAEEREDGVLVLVPAGRIDSGNARAFESIVTERITAGDHRLVVDFGNLDFISSSGLRVLLIAAKTVKAQSGAIALCSMKDHIQEVFQISGFDRIIPIRNTRPEALNVL